jgi:hypothetical protein
MSPAAAKPSTMICSRTRRMRWMSTCASATRSAAARRGAVASSPAIRPASSAASAASPGSASTGWFSP